MRKTRTANQLYANQQIQQAAVQRAKKSKSSFSCLTPKYPEMRTDNNKRYTFRDQDFKRGCLFFTSSLRDPRSLSFRAAYIRLFECEDPHQMCAYVHHLLNSCKFILSNEMWCSQLVYS